jgi:hypothetical protein
MKIKNRRRNYFERLMNERNDWEGVCDQLPKNMGLVRVIDMKDVKGAINRMKNGKAVGPDGIPIEVCKLLHELVGFILQ